jgi:hypothetical protein
MTPSQLARVVLVTFLLLFMAARMLSILVMAHCLPPSLFLHLGTTHIHHLNFGIFILSGVGAVMLFFQPRGRFMIPVAVAYGVGLALTFDEFGMWLHLGGTYWQRASFDAVVVIAALLALIAFRPALEQISPRQWWAFVALLLVVLVFAGLLVRSFDYVGRHFGPVLARLEQHGPK